LPLEFLSAAAGQNKADAVFLNGELNYVEKAGKFLNFVDDDGSSVPLVHVSVGALARGCGNLQHPIKGSE
jgi:hypothetical protein